MTPSPITIKYLTKKITDAVGDNPYFNSSVVGEKYDFDEMNPHFPCLWVIPNQYNPLPESKITEFTFMIASLDTVDEGGEMEIDALSRCATGLDEIYNQLRASLDQGGSNEGEMWRVKKMEGRQKIVDNLSSYVNGWMVELFIEAPFNQGTCTIPQ